MANLDKMKAQSLAKEFHELKDKLKGRMEEKSLADWYKQHY